MEHVHTFLFSKLCSSKERRLIFATPETPDAEPVEAEASPDVVADGEVDLVENFLDGMSEDELRALKEAIEARLSGDEEEEPEPPALPEDGEPVDEEPVEAPEPPVEEEPVDEEPVEAPEPPVEEEPVDEEPVEEEPVDEEPVEAPEPPVDPEIEPNVASELLDAAAGDSALVLAGALETGDFEGANTARLELQATLFDMVMSAEVNGGDINTWLEDKFPTFEVSYNEADMTVVIPALEDFSEEEPEEEGPVEAPEPPVEGEPEAAPELNDTMREILDSIAGPELDQVLRLDEMLDESNPESQLVMDQAIRELIQELAPQVDNGNITEEEINLWLREAFEGQQIPVYDHESGTITVTEEVGPVADPIEEEPTDTEAVTETVAEEPEGMPGKFRDDIEALQSEINQENLDGLVSEFDNWDEGFVEQGGNFPTEDAVADMKVRIFEYVQSLFEGKIDFTHNDPESPNSTLGATIVEAGTDTDTDTGNEEGDEKPETLREMLKEFFRELLKLLREGLAEARAQREQNANAPTTVTEADANVAAADAGVEAAEAAVAEAAEEVTTAETDAATAGTDADPEVQAEIESLRERAETAEADAEVSREEAARVREERDALLQRIAEQQTRIEELLIANNDVEAEIQVDPDAGLEGGITAINYDEAFYAYILEMQQSGEVETVEVDGGALHIHFNINYIENNIGGSNNNVINQQGEGNQAGIIDVDAGTDEPVEEVPAEEEPIEEVPAEEEPIEEEPAEEPIEEEPVEEEPIEEEVEEDTTSSTDGDEFADL